MGEPSRRLVITGATGMLGKNFVEEIIHLRSTHKNLDIKFYGSRNSTSKLKNNFEIDIFKLDYRDIKKFDPTHVIHLAFKTSKFINSMSAREYEENNLDIIANLEKIIAGKSLKKILYTSSGVEISNKIDESDKLYANLKKSEDQIIKKTCKIFNVSPIKLRLWSVSGKYMNKNDSFVLSEFIKKALRNEDIKILNPNIIKRTYLDAGDIAKLGLNLLFNYNIPFVECSNGKHIDLVNLAYKIKTTLNSNSKIFYSQDINALEERYYPEITNLNDISEITNIRFLSLEEQILKTAKYLDNSNKK